MSKYAIVICASHAYLMGLNATLNAIDYYGIKDVDVHIVSNPIMTEYLEYVKDKFTFPIYYYMAEDVCAGYPVDNLYWDDTIFVWAKYPLALKIKDQYEAILHLDGDCMITDDISANFKIAADTGKLLVAESPYSAVPMTEIEKWDKEGRLDDFCFGRPLLNYIVFYDAKKHVDIIEYVWALRSDKKLIKNSGLEPVFYIEALYKLNKVDQVIGLPGTEWIADTYLHHQKIPLVENDKYHLITPTGKPIQVMHGRFWNRSLSASTLERNRGSIHEENLIFNIDSHTRLTDFLNYKCTVSLDTITAMNNNYKSFCNI